MAPAQPRRAAPAARPAARSAPARTTGRSAAADTPVSSSTRGRAVLAKIQEEADKNEARAEARKVTQGSPYRYFTPPGETREVVVVDDAPEFSRHEHAIYNQHSKRWDTYVPCIDQVAVCPICATNPERGAYFAVYLTVIDLTPYTNSKGEEVPFSKKLMVIKQMQQKKFMRLFERHKTLRGMVLEMTRDDEKHAAIGDPEFIEFMDEEVLLEYITDYTDKDGKVHEVDCTVPFDYEEIMPDVTERQLIALVGGKPPPGSRADNDRQLGRGREKDAWGDDAPRTATRRGRPAPQEADDDPNEAQDDAPPPRRSARAAAPAPSRAAPRSRIHPDDLPDQGAEAGEEGPPWDGEGEEVPAARGPRQAAPARRAARPAPAEDPYDDVPPEEPATRRAAPAARQPARRAAPRDDEGYEDAPQRPARPAADVNARRASLRRG